MQLSPRTLLSVATTFAILASAVAAGDGGLHLTGKAGDVRKYKLSLAFKFQGQDITVTGGVNERVIRVDDAGLITIQVTAVNTAAKAGDQAIPVKDSPPLIKVFKPDGTLSELRGEDASQTAYRLETLTSVKLPNFALVKDKPGRGTFFRTRRSGFKIVGGL